MSRLVPDSISPDHGLENLGTWAQIVQGQKAPTILSILVPPPGSNHEKRKRDSEHKPQPPQARNGYAGAILRGSKYTSI